MNVQQQKQQKGFTIIEVILVLAIAGLIFLMVFLALPALQRGQRDTDRKNDASSVASAVTSFSSNNRGGTPTSAQVLQYATNLSKNTTAVTVASGATAPATAAPADATAAVVFGKKCNVASTTGVTLSPGSARQFVVVQKLESGNGTFYCLDS